jgi:chaperonin GroES
MPKFFLCKNVSYAYSALSSGRFSMTEFISSVLDSSISSSALIDELISSFLGIAKLESKLSEIKFLPLADRVIIQQAEAETKTASGIIIPDTAKEKPQKGTVIAVGKGTKENPITVSVGDTILYGKYAGTELKYNESDYLIMKESDILAIIK